MTTAIKTAATSQQVREPTRELDKAERRDELLDSELDTVTGGTKAQGKAQGSWFAAVATALGNQAADARSR